MKATIDANVLFSALLRDGLTRKALFSPELELSAPEFLLAEFAKYRAFLSKKFSGSEKEFSILLEKIISQITFVPDAELKPFLPAAASIIPDKKDQLYIACALKEDTVIWSNDAHFRGQKRIRVKMTAELAKEVGLL